MYITFSVLQVLYLRILNLVPVVKHAKDVFPGTKLLWSHTYISISCNRGQFDLKNPGFFKAICTCNQLAKFFCSFTYNNKQICSKKLFQNSVILQYIFISFNNSIHIGFSGIYSVEIIIVFLLITVFCFLTLASVLVIFPTFSDVPFSFFGE